MRDKFRSVHQAMSWSFRVSAKPVLSEAATYRMRGPAGFKTDLSDYERHAQAAQVLGMAAKALDVIEWTYAGVRWGRSPDLELLVYYLSRKSGLEERRQRGVGKLVRRWRGEEIGEAALRYDLRCRQADVDVYRRAVFGALQDLHDAVLRKLDHALADVVEQLD